MDPLQTKIIVGLGNPGPSYETTRHNVGFLAVDRLIERWQGVGPQKKFESEVFQAKIPKVREGKCLLVKPQTFMNLSGRSVGALIRFHKLPAPQLVVIHDEVDLPFGTLRFKQGGGHAGHNGLKSIDAELGSELTNNYYRVRVGVGRSAGQASVADHVLKPFLDTELEALDGLFDDITEAIALISEGKLQQAQTRFHETKTESNTE